VDGTGGARGHTVVPAFVVEPQPGRVVFGEGAVGRVPQEAERLGLHRLLFLHSGRDGDTAGALRHGLGERLAGEFTGIRPHVPLEVATRARQAAADASADGLLCLGGGSVTGTAKAVALHTGLPIIAVPTTYAGSEVTPVWGLTADGRKQTGTDPRVRPAAVVYDPDLTAGLPAGLSAASGLNALAHAVEAFWAPGRTPVTALYAAEAVRTLAEGLPAVVADGADAAARSLTLYGSYLAGAAFAVAGSGLHHKICHVLGGGWDLPHARTHAVVLPYVLAWNAARSPLAVRAVAAGIPATRPSPREAVAAVRALARAVGAPGSLAELGLGEPAIALAAAAVAPVVPADNPRPIAEQDLAVLLRHAWAGADPAELIEDDVTRRN
jgi:maleylacetate reductase